MFVTQQELSKIIGLSDTRIRKLEKEDKIFKRENRKYELEKCVPAYIEYRVNSEIKSLTGNIESAAGNTTDATEYLRARAEKTQAEASLKKLELEKRKKSLIEVSIAKDIISTAIFKAKYSFQNLGKKLAPNLFGLETPEMIDKIDREVNHILDELSKGSELDR